MFVEAHRVDLGVYGFVKFGDGIGRQSIGLIDCLKNDLSIKFVNTRKKYKSLVGAGEFQDVPEDVVAIILQDNQECECSVAILEDVLSNGNPAKPESYYQTMPDDSIKIAYSMFEASAIPHDWPMILNNHFDAVVVPDNFLVEVYKNSGVTIPIFVIPLGIYIDEFLSKPIKEDHHYPFTFGFSGAFFDRKNHRMLLHAFVQEFGNRPDVALKMHGRFGDILYKELEGFVATSGVTNVELRNKPLSWQEYREFIGSLDCYVSLSKGEGFSITPREAMAQGIPCIITNNTAQRTLCASGFVRSVESEVREAAYFSHLKQYVGYNFNCTLSDARSALRDVFDNYPFYKQKAKQAREWVQQYLYKNLRKRYLNLIKPSKIFLGAHDTITDDYFMTKSEVLYEKYQKTFKKSYEKSVEHLIDTGNINQCFNRTMNVLRLSGKGLTSLQGLDSVYGIQNITSLDLSNNSLQDLRGVDFSEFQNLRQIWLSNNNIAHCKTLEPLSKAPALKILNLIGNQISMFDMRSFKEYTSLQEIWLNHNRISEIIPDYLPTVREVHMAYNTLTELDCDSFSQMPWLYILNVAHNKIKTYKPCTKDAKFEHVESLNLADNRLQSLSPHAFKSMQTLKVLQLQDNFLESIDAGSFKGLSKLIVLNLHNNRLRNLGDNIFIDLSALRVLSLRNNQLMEFSDKVFSGLTNIKIIDCSDNPVMYITKDTMHAIPKNALIFLHS
jgi:hypothetical protein